MRGLVLVGTSIIAAAALVAACDPKDSPSVPGGPPAFPSSEFLFGFNLVAGVGPDFSEPKWPLSDEQLAVLREEIGINSIRFFVHPRYVGLPQDTWQGPEPIRYSAFGPGDYVWNRPGGTTNSLDEVLRKLDAQGITPMLQPMLPDDYVNWIYKPDITFLNASRGVDYTGVIPENEVQAIVVAIAAHVQQTFGKPFIMNLPEICGQNSEGPALRAGERAAWQRIGDAVRVAAPLVEWQGPEICVNNAWAWTQIKNGCGAFTPYAGADAPPSDALASYSQVHGVLSASGGLLAQALVTQVCPAQTRLRSTTDQDLFVVREQALPNRWIWAETTWASHPSTDEEHLHWAAIFFGMDHVRGLFVWDAKSAPAEDAPGGTPPSPGLWTSNNQPNPALEDWKVLGPILGANRAFLGAYHSFLNGDGLATDGNQFAEADPSVITRKLGRHLAVFSDGPAQVTLNSAGGATLVQAYNGGAAPAVQSVGGDIALSGLTPGRLYLFAIGP